MLMQVNIDALTAVAPFTGAWIEIISVDIPDWVPKSHPSRVRGLKS